VSANYSFASTYRPSPIPEPMDWPELYEGLLRRRVFAYLIDLLCIGVIAAVLWVVFVVLTVLSLGLLGPVLWFLFGLIPLAYHTILLSGRARPRGACAVSISNCGHGPASARVFCKPWCRPRCST
jgi:hypothetical protein